MESLPTGWNKVFNSTGATIGYLDDRNIFHQHLPLSQEETAAKIRDLERKIEELKKTRVEIFDLTGPLQKDVNFIADAGKELLIAASGSGHGSGLIGMTIVFNGTELGSCKCYTNETSSHKAFVSRSFKVTVATSGNQILSLRARAGTSTDTNDFYSITVTFLN